MHYISATPMRLVFAFLLFIPLFGLSQKSTVDRPDLTIEPKIYHPVYYSDKNDYRTVVERTVIVKYKFNNYKADTTYSYYYNNKGLKTKKICYENNKADEVTLFNYNQKGQFISWEIIGDKYNTTTKYIHNSKGEVIKTRQHRIKKTKEMQDSTLVSEMQFSYMDSQLTEIHYTKSMKDTYEYQEGILQFKKGGYISKEFIYNKKENLIRINDYMGKAILPDKLMAIKTYTYDDENRLISDSILTNTNLRDKRYQITHYTYNKEGQLQTMNVSYDGRFRNIEFIYKEDRLKEVKGKTNNINTAYLHFRIDFRIRDYYSAPIQFKEFYEYDKHGNRTSKKIYINKDLYSEVEYKMIYR